MPNHRQLAILVWLGAGVLFMMTRPDLRQSVCSVIRTVLHPKVVGVLLAVIAWIIGEVILLNHAGLWSMSLTTDTIFLIAGSALVITVGSVTEEDAGHYLTGRAKRALGVVSGIGFFMNISVFSLPWELGLAPTIFVLTVLAATASSRPAFRPVGIVCQSLLALIVLAMLVNSVLSVIYTSEHTLWPPLWRALTLPVWLFVGLLPLVWVLVLWSSYESAVVAIELVCGRSWERRLAILISSGWSQRRLRYLRRNLRWTLRNATTFRAARAALREADRR